MSYSYARRTGRRSANLTPPAELVGHMVRWAPKRPDGKRNPAVVGRVESFDNTTRTLTIVVSVPVSAWQPNPTRTATVPLSSGPFTVVS